MPKLPCSDCGGQCCTFPPFSMSDFKRVRKKYGIPTDARVIDGPGFKTILKKESPYCAYLQNGRCSIYDSRPRTCREYGINPKLPCQYLVDNKLTNRRIVG